MSTLTQLEQIQREIMGLVNGFQTKNDDRISKIEGKIEATTQELKESSDALARQVTLGGRGTVTAGNGDYQVSNAILEGVGYWAKTGEILNEFSVGEDAAGGYLVVPEVDQAVQSLVTEFSDLRPHATIKRIEGDAWEKVIDKKGITSGWRTEGGAVVETSTPDLSVLRVPLNELYAQPILTNKILDTSRIDIAQFIIDAVADHFSATEGAAFTTGSDVGQPKGFLDYTYVATGDATRTFDKMEFVASGAAGAFAAVDPIDPLIDLVHKVKARHRRKARWFMNDSTIAVVRKLKDADGNYAWQTQISDKDPNRFLGYPVSSAADMPNIAANSLSIAFGDFSQYVIVEHKQGLRLLRDNVTTKGKTKLYAYKLLGGGVIDTQAIKCLKFAA